jgi:hypothetical protein
MRRNEQVVEHEVGGIALVPADPGRAAGGHDNLIGTRLSDEALGRGTIAPIRLIAAAHERDARVGLEPARERRTDHGLEARDEEPRTLPVVEGTRHDQTLEYFAFRIIVYPFTSSRIPSSSENAGRKPVRSIFSFDTT